MRAPQPAPKTEILPTMTSQHQKQHLIWDEEHRRPFMFPFVASTEPNAGVVAFWNWLQSKKISSKPKGLEICCGKGRNAIWLAGKGVEMSGFDFSSVAITEATDRVRHLSLPATADFRVHDAVVTWPYADQIFDFVVDCFGSSDIEGWSARRYVLDESLRVLKPGGYHFLQIDTPEMGFFAERFKEAPGPENNTLVFPNGKIEALLLDSDIVDWKHPLKLIEVRTEIETELVIFGQSAPYKYFWIVAQAPSTPR
jgi:SAM-dependent methyltransferase